MNLSNSTVIGIPTKLDARFFRYWVEFLRPLHKIGARDSQILAELLYQRHLLSRKISDDSLVDKLLLSKDMRKVVSDACGVSKSYFEVILDHLRKKDAVIDNRINRKFIPNFEEGEKDIKLIVHFRFNESD